MVKAREAESYHLCTAKPQQRRGLHHSDLCACFIDVIVTKQGLVSSFLSRWLFRAAMLCQSILGFEWTQREVESGDVELRVEGQGPNTVESCLAFTSAVYKLARSA